jgi:hypothetical protein
MSFAQPGVSFAQPVVCRDGMSFAQPGMSFAQPGMSFAQPVKPVLSACAHSGRPACSACRAAASWS